VIQKLVLITGTCFYTLTACKTKKIEPEISWPFDERLYFQVDSILNDSGVVISRGYRSKIDPQRMLRKNFNYLGKIYLSAFYFDKVKEGPFKTFNPDGSIQSVSWLHQNKISGLNLIYDNDTVTSVSIYLDGIDMMIDSVEERRLRDSINLMQNYKDSLGQK